MPLSYKHNFKALYVGNAIAEISAWQLTYASAEHPDPLFEPYDFFHDDVDLLEGYKNLKASFEASSDQGVIQTHYASFFSSLTAFYEKVIEKDAGYDILTGLKSESAVQRDVEREMEKLQRYKKPFSIGMLRIDGFGEGGLHLDAKQVLRCRLAVSDVLQYTLRSFDDAYAMQDGTFLVCVKEASNVDGMRALERIRDEVAVRKISYDLGKEDGALTVSCISAEPLEREEIGQTLEYLRQELNNNLDKKSQVLAYHEVSPIERFAKERE